MAAAHEPALAMHGLYKDLNHMSKAPPGSCRTIQNAMIRQPGIIEPMHSQTNYRTWSVSPFSAAVEGVRVLETDGSYLLVIVTGTQIGVSAYKTYWIGGFSDTRIDNQESNNLWFGTSAGDADEEGYASSLFVRDRTFLTTADGVQVMDAIPSSTSRFANLGFITFLDGAFVSSVATAVVNNDKINVRAVFRRESGSYVIQGPPSYVASFFNTHIGGTGNLDLDIEWGHANDNNLLVGDIVEVYRTRAVTGDISAGSRYFKWASVVLTSSHLSARQVTILCSGTDDDLGVELYTNPGEESETQTNYPPPQSRALAQFRGVTFYASERIAHNLTLRIPQTWGLLDTDGLRTNGIGRRDVTGDTNTDDTITNINTAAHFFGVVVGQLIDHADFPAGTKITSIDVGAKTITCDQAANASNTSETISVYDQLLIRHASTPVDVEYTMESGENFLLALSAAQSNAARKVWMSVADRPIAQRGGLRKNGVTSGVSFTLARFVARSGTFTSGEGFSVQATNGQNYDPPIGELASGDFTASDADIKTNRLHFSKRDQPEHVPPGNTLLVGHGLILALAPTQDVMYVFCTDGIYAVTGTAPSEWRVDPFEVSHFALSPGCVATSGRDVFAWTNHGMIQISSGMLINLSRDRLNKEFKSLYSVVASSIPNTWKGQLAVDPLNHEVHLLHQRGTTNIIYVWNWVTQEWWTYKRDKGAESIAWWAGQRAMAWGAVDTGTTMGLQTESASATSRLSGLTGGVILDFNAFVLGNPGILKQFKDVIWYMTVPGGGEFPASFAVTIKTQNDVAFGGTEESNAHTFLNSTVSGTPGHRSFVTAVPIESALGYELRVRMETATAGFNWELEGMELIAYPLSDPLEVIL